MMQITFTAQIKAKSCAKALQNEQVAKEIAKNNGIECFLPLNPINREALKRVMPDYLKKGISSNQMGSVNILKQVKSFSYRVKI
jgi:hypothetical protein